MPVISNLDLNTLTAKIGEYSRLEQFGAVFVGAIAFYVLHSVSKPVLEIRAIANIFLSSCSMHTSSVPSSISLVLSLQRPLLFPGYTMS